MKMTIEEINKIQEEYKKYFLDCEEPNKLESEIAEDWKMQTGKYFGTNPMHLLIGLIVFTATTSKYLNIPLESIKTMMKPFYDEID